MRCRTCAALLEQAGHLESDEPSKRVADQGEGPTARRVGELLDVARGEGRDAVKRSLTGKRAGCLERTHLDFAVERARELAVAKGGADERVNAQDERLGRTCQSNERRR
jgi:hypothetical protein